MKWSWKVGQVAGIGIYVHWTFLILIGWFVLLQVLQGSGFLATAEAIGFVLAVFGCVVLHELGHALVARRYGIRTRDITLLPIGGLARLERMPENPRQELGVALAGPAVNLMIAAVLSGILLVFGGLPEAVEWRLVGGHFLVNLLIVNVGLVVFNMLPAFPMDGGRVLRAILVWVSGNYARATQQAAAIGQGMAIVFGFLGLATFNPFLVFIALFVYLAAQEEATRAHVGSVFKGLPVRQAMMTRFRTLSPEDTLDCAIEELMAGAQHDFPVVDNERIIGVLFRQDLIKALADGRRAARVDEIMERDCSVVHDGDLLESVFEQMREDKCSSLPVLHGDRLVGVVTLENVGELVMIQDAIEHGNASGIRSREMVLSSRNV